MPTKKTPSSNHESVESGGDNAVCLESVIVIGFKRQQEVKDVCVRNLHFSESPLVNLRLGAVHSCDLRLHHIKKINQNS